MNEIWKPIEGYEGVYEVSNLGRVRSLTRIDSRGRLREGVVLKPCYDSRRNYLHVNLRGKPCNIHRLVAKTFISNPHDYAEINHKDEDKTNNCVENLEWCTHKYNNNYGSKPTKSRGINNPQSKLTESDIIEIRKLYKPHNKCYGAKALAQRFGVSYHHIYHIVRNDKWGWL